MNKFRNAVNARLLKGLFFETSENKSQVVYTLKDVDHEGFPSLYRLYMEIADPTEYRFAIECLDGLEHWEMLCACKWFETYVSRWRRELELKIRSQALLNIQAEANKPNSKNSFTANKFLIDGGWLPKSTKGRPSKADVSKAAKAQAEENFLILDAFKKLPNHDIAN